MNNSTKRIQKGVAIAAACVLFAQTASAFSGAVLKGVKIDSLKGRDYRVTIKTDKDVPIKKYVTASNKVVLELQDVRPAQFLNTIYNGATEMDHVIVQPYSNDKLRIFLQGLNISSSQVILDTRDEVLSFLQTEPLLNADEILLGAQEASKESKPVSNEPIFIDLSDKAPVQSVSKSVDKVKSVTPILSYEERSRNNLQGVQNSMAAGSGFLNASAFDWVLRILTLLAVVAAGIKWARRPKNVEINLSSNDMKSREMDLYKSTDLRKERLTKSLGMPATNQRIVKNSSISQYGLKEYQNSQLPPRKTISQQLPERSRFVDRKSMAPKKANSARPVQKPANVRSMNATKVSRKQTEQARKDFDSVKFLETMASIYQKSGRDDLASGIRQNIVKQQKAV